MLITNFIFSQRIAGGGQHSVTVCENGKVMSWGSSYSGQLGAGNLPSSSIPVEVIGLHGITAIASGWEHSLAIKSDSTVWSWGYNGFGQMGDGSTKNSNVPVKMISADGTLSICNGHLHTHSLFVKSDGSAWACGRNSSGQIGDGTTSTRNLPVKIHGLNNIGYLENIVAVSGGHDYSLALDRSGKVYSWGANSFGQLGNSSNTTSLSAVLVDDISDVISIAVGDWSSIALKKDSTVWTWGYNGSGRLGDNTLESRNKPVQVVGENGFGFLSGIVKIAAGESHELALRSDGTVWTWGKNLNGQLGDNTVSDRSTPVQVKGPGNMAYLNDIIEISGGARHSLALQSDGTVWAWGDNSNGQLGDGTFVERRTPVKVLNLCKLTRINKLNSPNELQINPNPFRDKFTLAGLHPEKISEIKIFNGFGECMSTLHTSGKPTLEIELENLPAGMYIIHITQPGTNSNKTQCAKYILSY